MFKDVASGSNAERKALAEVFSFVRKGDALVVWKLDRLGRSLRHLLELVERLKEKGVEFISLQDSIDTTSASGKMVFSIMGAIAEFELDLIKERTNAGLQAARARGRKGGRKGLPPEKILAIKAMYADPKFSITDIAKTLSIHRSTIYKHLPEKAPTAGKKP